MNTKVLDFQVNNRICEADGCIAKATNEIKVNAGPQKVISLLLCNDCISKFQEVTQT
ncbi:MAG TPA: hypothetical protein VH796_03390 [Nitrososphaeraceae archaeon]